MSRQEQDGRTSVCSAASRPPFRRSVLSRRLVLLLALAGGAVTGTQSRASAAQDRLPKYAAVLAGQPELQQSVSVTAYRTTVGELLQQLSKTLGVRLEAGEPEVAQEGIIAFFQPRPAQSVLTLLAAQFRWGEREAHGWYWTRRTSNGKPVFVLERDWQTRTAIVEQARQARLFFLEACHAEVSALRNRDARPGDEHLQIVAALPPAVVEAAVLGTPQSLAWNDLPPRLRDLAPGLLGGGHPAPGESSRIEVMVQGSGGGLKLLVQLMTRGHGGGGALYQPRPYFERYGITKGRSLRRRPPREMQKDTGLASRPLTVEDEETREWLGIRHAPEFFSFIVKKTGTDLICDDYDYNVYWGAGNIIPKGEQLGWFLGALSTGFRTPHNPGGCRMEWREQERCLLIRNRDWISEMEMRPPADVAGWLSQLQRQPGGHTLSVPELMRLLARTDDYSISTLRRSGLLAPDCDLRGWHGMAQLWAILNPEQQRRLLSNTGLSFHELSAAQRRQASEEGPGRYPFFNAVRIAAGTGYPVLSLARQGSKLTLRSRRGNEWAAGETVNLRLPPPTVRVCKVALAGDGNP